ncbi:MAG: CPCC family cysteine-rich protein [Acidobacteria bacterium]|nr:CPCC family cysteine-rich protein [Acidobacteriota bacterium]
MSDEHDGPEEMPAKPVPPKRGNIRAIALAWEGTLVSTRPGRKPRWTLGEFLNTCASSFDAVYLFSGDGEADVRRAVQNLSEDIYDFSTFLERLRIVPNALAPIDLGRITDFEQDEIVLFASTKAEVLPAHEKNCVRTSVFEPPYDEDVSENPDCVSDPEYIPLRYTWGEVARKFFDRPPYPCPGCGYLMYDEPGGYFICPICGWEDDPVQLQFFTSAVGANEASLYDHQQSVEAAKRKSALPLGPYTELDLDPDWRPITQADIDALPRDNVESGEEYFLEHLEQGTFEDAPEEHFYWLRKPGGPDER